VCAKHLRFWAGSGGKMRILQLGFLDFRRRRV
jgi:hypothetical protein